MDPPPKISVKFFFLFAAVGWRVSLLGLDGEGCSALRITTDDSVGPTRRGIQNFTHLFVLLSFYCWVRNL